MKATRGDPLRPTHEKVLRILSRVAAGAWRVNLLPHTSVATLRAMVRCGLIEMRPRACNCCYEMRATAGGRKAIAALPASSA